MPLALFSPLSKSSHEPVDGGGDGGGGDGDGAQFFGWQNWPWPSGVTSRTRKPVLASVFTRLWPLLVGARSRTPRPHGSGLLGSIAQIDGGEP